MPAPRAAGSSWSPTGGLDRFNDGALILASTAAAAVILALILVPLDNLGDRNDFPYELWPAWLQLEAGHVLGFVRQVPFYFGAALWRAPIAIVAIGAGAGWRSTFFLSAVPCLAALPLLGAWLAPRIAGGDRTRRRGVLMAFCGFTVLDPLVWFSGLLGHPEELVGIALMVAAVVCAAEGRLAWAIGLTAFGLSNKPGLGELVPVVAAAFPARWARPALIAGLGLVLAYALYNLTPLAGLLPIHELTNGAATPGQAQPADLLWWLDPGAWAVTHEHVLIVPVCTAVAAAWWQRRGRGLERGPGLLRELLWLMVFVLLLRTALDPWDVTYYNLPLVVALLCLEAGRRWRLTVPATVAVLVLVPTNRLLPIGPNAQAALYAIVVVPALIAIGRRAFSVGGEGGPGQWSGVRPGVSLR